MGALAPGELRVWWCPAGPASPRARRSDLDALLRRLLAPTLGLPAAALRFAREARGRPFLDHPGAPDFNLSDTKGGRLVAMACHGRVGVDLERWDRSLPVARLARRWFSAPESAALAAMPAESARLAFLRLWTAKEASCKATGTGIYGRLPDWVFDADGEQPRLLAAPPEAAAHGHWRFLRLAPASTHTAVLAWANAGVDGEYRLTLLTAGD